MLNMGCGASSLTVDERDKEGKEFRSPCLQVEDNGEDDTKQREQVQLDLAMWAMFVGNVTTGAREEVEGDWRGQYVARNCGSWTIFKLDLRCARANCSHVSSGKGAEAKGMVYTSVLKHGGIVMQCANGSTYPGGPSRTTL